MLVVLTYIEWDDVVSHRKGRELVFGLPFWSLESGTTAVAILFLEPDVTNRVKQERRCIAKYTDRVRNQGHTVVATCQSQGETYPAFQLFYSKLDDKLENYHHALFQKTWNYSHSLGICLLRWQTEKEDFLSELDYRRFWQSVCNGVTAECVLKTRWKSFSWLWWFMTLD